MSAEISQNWSEAQIAVALFFGGSAVVIGLDALKQTGARAKVLWAISVISALAGFLVKPFWEKFPDVSLFLASIATWPPAWFMLLIGGYLVIRAKLPLKPKALDDDIISKLIDERFAALPAPANVMPDTSQFQDRAMREIEALAAIQKTAIEENKATHQLCNSLKSEVAALAATGFSLPANILEDIQKGVTAFERIEHAKRVEQAKSALDQCEKRHLATPENNTSFRKDSLNAMILGSIQESATMLGIDQDYIEQKKQEIKQGVEADAQFLEFTDDDKKTWLHKFEKRNFIIQSKQRDELLDMIRKVVNGG